MTNTHKKRLKLCKNISSLFSLKVEKQSIIKLKHYECTFQLDLSILPLILVFQI